jgi:hypothetical protein
MKITKYIIAAIVALGVTLGAAANAMTVTYTALGVPNINSSFKSYMDYGCITSKSSPQYKYLTDWCWVDYDGFVRCDGENDLGVTSDYYAVAMGSYYGTEIGTKYRVATDTGNVFYCVLVDCKANCNTNGTNQYGTDNNDILEFIVNTYVPTEKNGKLQLHNSTNPDAILDGYVQQAGSANVYMPLNGRIASVEKISFVWEE